MKISLVSVPVQDPIKAHEIYTDKLGFLSKEFEPDSSLAIVVSAEDPDGVAILLARIIHEYIKQKPLM